MSASHSAHILAATPSAAQRALRKQIQIAHVRQLWMFLGGVLAFFTLLNFVRYLWSKLFSTPSTRADGTKEKADEEKHSARPSVSTPRRSWWALATGFRIVFFRWSIPIGPSAIASVTELSFICVYIVANLVWLLVNTQDLQALFYQDRAALMASSQIPLVVALAGKNNVISWLTGVSHERLNVLHRAAARTIFILLWIHAVARVVSGLSAQNDFSHVWMQCGVLGLTGLTIATILSVRPIRQLAFEFFLVTHIICVLIFIVGGYYHAKEVHFGDYIWPALLIWGFDRALRMGRLVLNNRIWNRAHPGDALVELISEDTIRLTLRRRISWAPGQHAYVILPTVSNLPFEAHPFTIASIPEDDGDSKERDVVFLIRGRGGFTRRLREHAARDHGSRVPAFIDGPYGCPPDLRSYTTCILIAGGSGISYTLPLLLNLVRVSAQGGQSAVQRIVFIWAVRNADHIKWVTTVLQEALARATQPLVIEPRIYVTGKKYPIPEVPPASQERSSVSSSSIEKDDISESALPVYSALKFIHGRPNMKQLLSEEIENSPGPVSVDVAGPSPLAESIRRALSSGAASPASAFKGSSPVTLHVEAFGMSVVDTNLRRSVYTRYCISAVGMMSAPPERATDFQVQHASQQLPDQSHEWSKLEVSLDDNNNSDPEDEERFVYPTEESDTAVLATTSHQVHPSPAQLESIYAAASSGDLQLLKKLFRTALDSGDVESFSLANDASTRTGFTALHAAASRGFYDIVAWLIEECGAMPDLEDREGETALHKAALNGHIRIVQYLLPDKADVHARDADGWTALHNSCSKGYLDIVRWLCENGGAASTSNGVRGVDARSKDGWTPLMNAASKGHLPVVLYLLTKQAANPLIRNKWGETAFDIAAAVFEVWICEILQQAEAERWRGVATPYNPLLVHTTLPLILYENQRLDTRLKTVAVSGGRPKFSASGLGRHGRRAPFELKLPQPDEETGARLLPAWRSGVQLPLRKAPWALPRPATVDQPASESLERSHFWLSDWTLDVTHPAVDAEEGWQYAQSFDDPDDKWTAEMPLPLQRIMSGHGIVSAGFGGPPSRSETLSSSHQNRAKPTWVRRRRWVRIMRRRLDIPPLAFLEPDGAMYHLDFDGSLIPYVEDANIPDGGEARELSAMTSTPLSSQDYVARARYLVGNQLQDSDSNGTSLSAVEIRRAIAKVERATMELRQGLLSDEDPERKIQAEVLLNAYSRELERRRLAASSQGILISEYEDDLDDVDDNSSDEEFHYPQSEAEETPTPLSRSSTSADYFSRPGQSRVPADLTPQLTQAPDFRVPTREAPQKVLTPRWTSPTPHQLHAQWERDETVSQCRDCQRRFNFLNRRHCRKCGRIFCDRCSSYRAVLDPADVIHDPMAPEAISPAASHRVCQSCFEETSSSVPSRWQRTSTMERIVVDEERLTIPGSLTRRQSSSQLSDLADCPVCNQNLDDVGDAQAQEIHVKNCLEGTSGKSPSGIPQAAKYLVYRLPAESALIGVECVICLEEFVKGSTVARLSCFCSFHSACLSSWLQRGKSCPVHAR